MLFHTKKCRKNCACALLVDQIPVYGRDSNDTAHCHLLLLFKCFVLLRGNASIELNL